jgi:hypothetical protein
MTGAEILLAMGPSCDTDGCVDLFQEGRDMTVIKRSSTSNMSALSETGVESSSPHEGTCTSRGATDILEETERLLEKMNTISKLNANALASVGLSVEPDTEMPIITNSSDNNDNNNNKTDGKDAEEEAPELNEMLEKAVHLSSMMLSISEHMSYTGDAASRKAASGYSITAVDNSQYMHMSMSSIRSAARDPDGSSMSDLQHLPKLKAVVTPDTTDDASSFAKRSFRQDPPGSTVLQPSPTKIGITATLPPTPISLHQRPASSVHVLSGMNDDDVSSVGSSSFRPSNYSQQGERGNSSRHFSPQRDDLLGVLPSRKMEQAGTRRSVSPVDPILESLPQEPVCTKIPPTDLRANFDVVDSSSPRNTSDGVVQWEKVSTAAPGEEDYVPLVDYTNMKVSQAGGRSAGGSPTAQGSRLERHRKQVEARQKRRLVSLAIIIPIALVVAAATYFQHFMVAREEIVVENKLELEEPVIVPIFKSYDTALLQDRDPDNGFCFDAVIDVSGIDDHSLLVTFPKFIPPVEVKMGKKKRGGLFGLFGKK